MQTPPSFTYRIQFHRDFPLARLQELIPYLAELGVQSIYASPIFTAIRGSQHGYDGINPNEINPEIGTLAELKRIHKIRQAVHMGWIQDIVPNHLAYHPTNAWLWDLLEKGTQSAFSTFFDTAFASDYFEGPLMLPILEAPLSTALQKKNISVQLQSERYTISYQGISWPINEAGQQFLSKELATVLPEEIPAAFDRLSKRKKEQLLSCQYYRFCPWTETCEQINYRRFFTVNGLIGVEVQHSSVFKAAHALAIKLSKQGVFTGLRIDHIDGLRDPLSYVDQLRQAAGSNCYLVAEKIWSPGESSPNWSLQGTTGYDFLQAVNRLLVQTDQEAFFTRLYKQFTGDKRAPQRQLYEKKALILDRYMHGELQNLYRLFQQVYTGNLQVSPTKTDAWKEILRAFLIYCPVYRFYGNQLPFPDREKEQIRAVFHAVRQDFPRWKHEIRLMEQFFIEGPVQDNPDMKGKFLEFYQRCMQLTGPLMAKGMEDTLFYTDYRFIALNEVGGTPLEFGLDAASFHQLMQKRAEREPEGMNATATHDTKRGEDMRARLQVLSEMPHHWKKIVYAWKELNTPWKQEGMPDAQDEYFIYQTLVGCYPMPGIADKDFRERLAQYLTKAFREAKRHTSWESPQDSYEQAVTRFVRHLLEDSSPFKKSLEDVIRLIADWGIVHSLCQVMLKFTCPGIPDVYQGTEGWDLSLVDPDNRRPVDYALRSAWLRSFPQQVDDSFLTTLWQQRYEGQLKCWLIQQLAEIRRADPELFSAGNYEPVKVEGVYKKHILAFSRRYQDRWILVIIPLNLCSLGEKQDKDPLQIDWDDTHLRLPPDAPRNFICPLDGSRGQTDEHLFLKDFWKQLPLTVLKLFPSTAPIRKAGVLLPITALPGPFPIGDLGPQAVRFIDLLSRARQKYWQLLPLGPFDSPTQPSPYSLISSMAGNDLLVSPELLQEEGWLSEAQLAAFRSKSTPMVDYEQANAIKDTLFQLAFDQFNRGGNTEATRSFTRFCGQEAYWLDDFALYKALKSQLKSPWYEWPKALRTRDKQALALVAKQHAKEIQRVKWIQYHFYKQWHRLKQYSQIHGIELIGDLPFYMNHDSVDVWTHPHLFQLDTSGQMASLAGVPPDYFQAEGQLWNMPLYQWETHQQEAYTWWKRRLKKYVDQYDLIRLDHFRAFYNYWDVPATEKNAVNGQWKQGPGSAFFNAIAQELEGFPFIAEDLGDISEEVIQLRDEWKLPGMKVLQFAFGDDPGSNPHAPHLYSPHFFVYTGTHDNNTARGWYEEELNDAMREALRRYSGVRIKPKNVARVLTRMAYGSVAQTAMIPMQDLLGLDGKARLNRPASLAGNWRWRLSPTQLNGGWEHNLEKWTRLYGRG